MSKDMFRARGEAEEAVYFHQQDERLIEKIRAKARVAEIAGALADKLHVDNPQLLERIAALGITRDTGGAFLLLPLIQTAWADGHVSHHERDAILRIGAERGVLPGSADHARIDQWLSQRPSDELFDAALEAIRVGVSVLPGPELRDRIAGIVDACREVASASGPLGKVLHPHGGGISARKQATLDLIRSRLEAQPTK
jgi:hypothetical protein